MNSDEEDSYDSPDIKRRGASVDDFLKGSELGKQVSVGAGSLWASPATVPCAGSGARTTEALGEVCV